VQIAERILELMQKKNIKASKLTSDLGLSVSAITDWKKGKSKPSTDAVIKIAEYFNVTTDYLLICKEEERNNLNLLDYSKEEIRVIKNFQNLNQAGKEKVIEYIEDMLLNPKYINSTEEMAASLEIEELPEVKKLRKGEFLSDIDRMRDTLDAQEAVDKFLKQDSKKERLYS